MPLRAAWTSGEEMSEQLTLQMFDCLRRVDLGARERALTGS